MFKTTYFQRPVSNQWSLAIFILFALPFVNATLFHQPIEEKTKAGSAENTVAFMPALQAAQHIAGVAPATSGLSGRFDVIAEVIVQNIGTVDLTNLSITQALNSPTMLGTAFVNMTSIPQLVPVGAQGNLANATIAPNVNVAFTGTGDLLNGGGLLQPGQVFVVRFRFEVNPMAAGAPLIPKFQATASGTDSTPTTVSDLSDSGYLPQSSNPGWPGNSGGSDDPTPLTNCWDLVNNGIACNNLMQVSLNQDCIAALTPEMVLEGEYPQCNGDALLPLGGYYRIQMVTTQSGAIVPDMVPSTVNIYEIDGSYINQTLTVKVKEIVTSNNCWGNILLKDKLKPVINCVSPVVVNCNQNTATVPAPAVTDNCDPNPVISLANTAIIDNNICDDGIFRIRRTYTAFDASGNQAVNCIQELHVIRPPVDFPEDIAWTCTQYNNHPNIVNPTPLNPLVVDITPGTPEINVSPTLPASVLSNTGSGVLNVSNSPVCSYNILPNDEIVNTCGTSFKIIRTWTVLDWCTGSFITTGVGGEDNVQVIKIEDNVAPVITRPPFQVSANIPAVHPNPCRSQGFLLPPAVTDNCNSFTVQILTPVGEAIYVGMDGSQGGTIPPPGLTVGTHNITYLVTDACGNQSSLIVPVTVVDNISPTAICDELTDVNLNSNGTATVFAATFDDGSLDNCCVHHFEVRRMSDPCDDGHDDTVFGPSVVFCCNDVANSPIMVVFRVYDCYNNFNDCMVMVEVNDKIPPVIASCPSSQRITCDFYVNNLETQLAALAGNPVAQNELLDAGFGTPAFTDNCGFTLTKNITISVNQCKEGTITRTWRATDPSGLQSPVCSQPIFVDHVSDFVVQFPADLTVNCGDTLPGFGQPQIFFTPCEMIGISWQDTTYYSVSGACFKTERTWQVINWCVLGSLTDQEVVESSERAFQLAFPGDPCDFDGDGDCDTRTFRDSWRVSPLAKPGAAQANQSTNPDTDPDSDPWDGFITYKQTMHVIDAVSPVFLSCAIDTICVSDSLTCTATVMIPMPSVLDCSPNVTITATSSLGAGFGPFTMVDTGSYTITFIANDGCNNQSTCTATLVVADCKKPVIYCKPNLPVEINPGIFTPPLSPPMVTVNASQLDDGSFDSCGGPLQFSFSSDVNNTTMTYFCDQLGTDSVEMWVTDAAGNQDFCKTAIIVQASNNQCPDDPLVNLGGFIKSEDNDPTGNVTVSLSGQSNGSLLTGSNGSYTFAGVPAGNDVTVTPFKDDNHLQGVTSYDLVLISQHILGIQPLNSPYKRIAADANNSKSITTFDLVEIRKLILHITDKFANNTSWRFVDKKYVFPNPANPWLTQFPEIININDIPADVLDADFVAVKIGDVNNSANFTGDGPDDRSANGTLVFETEDLQLAAGETYSVDFSSRDFDVSGFQFTLDFDAAKIAFVEVSPAVASHGNFGLALLDEGAITASWNESSESISPDAAIFRLVFKARTKGRLSEMLRLSGRFTPAEAYEQDGSLLGVKLQFGNGQTSGGFVLYQNKPNPFGQETVIGFHLPQPAPATLSVLDVSGRLVKEVKDHFAEGYNEIRLKRQDLPLGGIFYYRLDTPTDSDIKKMILIE
jgi:hypothetical protein